MPQLTVKDHVTGDGIPLMNVRLASGTQPSDEAIFDVFTDYVGTTGWPIPYFPVQDWALHVNFANVNPKYVPQSYYILASDLDNITISLERVKPTRLHVQGHNFVDPSGNRVFLKGVTDFLLYKRFLDGENIDGILAERACLGANCVRVIGMVSSFSHWYPQEYGQRYYDSLSDFFNKLADFGLYCYFTVFADTQIVMPSKTDQINHFNKVVAEMKQCANTIGELVNEPYAHDNATDDPNAFTRPTEVAFSAGSYNDQYPGAELGKPAPPPYWDFFDFHVPRVSEPNKEGKNVADQCMTTNPNYKLGMAVLSGEPDKFGRPDPNGKVRHTDPDLARRMAGTARGTTCGVVYHTNAGIMSVPFDDTWNEIKCAQAWFKELA